MLFRGKPKPATLVHTLVGAWRAETLSGDVKGEILAWFHEDGSYLTRNQMEIRGVAAQPVTQTGRYRVEPLDRTQPPRIQRTGKGSGIMVKQCGTSAPPGNRARN